MDKFEVRRMAALFGLIGFTSTIGALLSGNNPVGSVSLVLLAGIALAIAHD